MQTVNIFTAHYDNIPVRFVYLAERKALFVSKDDIAKAIKSCWVSQVVPFELMPSVNDGLAKFADSSEKAAAVLDIDSIGGVVNVLSAGNLLSVFENMHDAYQPDLREFAFRVHTLLMWYVSKISEASDLYGLSFADTIEMARDHMDKHNPALPIHITETEGVWVAECDALGLVTEADGLDALRERVWEIAPELAELNGLKIPANELRLHFDFTDSAAQYQHRMVG